MTSDESSALISSRSGRRREATYFAILSSRRGRRARRRGPQLRAVHRRADARSTRASPPAVGRASSSTARLRRRRSGPLRARRPGEGPAPWRRHFLCEIGSTSTRLLGHVPAGPSGNVYRATRLGGASRRERRRRAPCLLYSSGLAAAAARVYVPTRRRAVGAREVAAGRGARRPGGARVVDTGARRLPRPSLAAAEPIVDASRRGSIPSTPS